MSLLRDNYSLIKSEYMRQWLLQGKLTPGISQAISRESSLLESEWLMLAVVKVDGFRTTSENYDFQSRKLYKYAIGNMAGELLQQSGCMTEFVDFGGDHLAIMIAVPQRTTELRSVCLALSRQVAKHTGLEVTIGLSNAYRPHDHWRKVYDDVCELTLFKFIRGEDKVYTEQDYEQYAELNSTLEDDWLDSLIGTIRSGKEEWVQEELEDIFRRFHQMKYGECQFQLRLLLFTVVKSFSKLTSIQSIDGIDHHLKQFARLEDVSGWLREEIHRIISTLSDQRGCNRREKLVDEMLQYIHYHVHDPALSVDQIADHVSLSAKYVRTLFQEHQGISLSNYILGERIKKVQQLLLQTDQPISDISEQCGFQAKSHFFTAFKRATGMTPSQYRQQEQGGEGGEGGGHMHYA
ncbi:helix-turn-helix transcriptional regulator [Paenibacillus sp. J5C2022]|uniref:helix-turn-helix transcriptional regulator n=1 Tax=Paenibacillus sp. J5C2022 TaxID=2977129 RepID=UPI0021CFD3C6|nr:helix-turn-helix transcriptional regulator [Paenibacillus sp. J5C2022]